MKYNSKSNCITSGLYLLGSRSREIYDTFPLAQSLFAISLISVILFRSVSIVFLAAFEVGCPLIIRC